MNIFENIIFFALSRYKMKTVDALLYLRSGKIKMKTYRIFLLAFATVSWLFLSGLSKSVDNRVELKSENSLISVNEKTKTPTTKKPLVKSLDNRVDDSQELQKPLDLSLPFQDAESTRMKTGQGMDTDNQEANLFAPANKKKTRPLQLKGDLLMSPEPEMEKQKSVDGAGIVINLKP